MQISNTGIEFIQSQEGCRLRAYRCPAGVLTIGYGHTSGVKDGMSITREQAVEYLRRDVKPVETCITQAAPGLNQAQFDALCSFAYNVGCGAFLKSGLLRKVKANPSDPSIRAEFGKYRLAGGKVLPGLEKRRAAEADLYFGIDG